MDLQIRRLRAEDPEPISAAFDAIGWNKPVSQYQRYFAEQEAGRRVVFVADADGRFAGYVTVIWEYEPFRDAQIPEIQDFNVLPAHRRQGIGSRLMEEAERLVGTRTPIVGIGVGLYADYGAAQRLYARRGYIPDGRGITYDRRVVKPGEYVPVDDSLVLYLTKRLRP